MCVPKYVEKLRLPFSFNLITSDLYVVIHRWKVIISIIYVILNLLVSFAFLVMNLITDKCSNFAKLILNTTCTLRQHVATCHKTNALLIL